jgi:hypothetical protein
MTFRTRLTLAYLALLTTALSGFGLWVYAYVDRNLHQEFYVSVQRQSVQLAQVLAGDYDAAANNAKDTLDRLTTGQEGDTYIVVETQVGKELELAIEAKHPEDALSGVDLPIVPPGQVVEVRPSANDLGLPLAVYAKPFEARKAIPRARSAAPDQPPQTVELQGQVTVARSLASVERSLRLLRTILIAGGLAVLLVAALLGLGLAAALLRPVCGPPPSGSATSATSPTACRSTPPPTTSSAACRCRSTRCWPSWSRPTWGSRRPWTPSAASWPTPPTSCAPR